MISLDILKTLCAAFGPSSAEGPVRDKIKKILKNTCEFVTTSHGNLIAYKPGDKGKKIIAFQAHMDELGFHPYRYRDDGYIELSPASPIPETASNQLLVFYPNEILGVLLITRNDKGLKYFLDIGAKSREEAMEMIPSYSNGAYKGDFRETPNFMCGKSFDDRAGCAAIVHLLLNNVHSDNRIIGLFTTREENGNWPIPELRDALLQADLKPDLVVNVEVCPGGPTPIEADSIATVGKGIALTHMDRYYISDSVVCQKMVELAERGKIVYQQMSERGGGGELGAICLKLGVHGYSLVIPGRYMHSPHSVISRLDYEAAIQMINAIANSNNVVPEGQ